MTVFCNLKLVNLVYVSFYRAALNANAV